jgi:hypothetical protein
MDIRRDLHREFPSRISSMLHNHLYETIMLFLTGVGFGIYVYGLRRFYRSFRPRSYDRLAQRAKTAKSKEHPETRSV